MARRECGCCQGQKGTSGKAGVWRMTCDVQCDESRTHTKGTFYDSWGCGSSEEKEEGKWKGKGTIGSSQPGAAVVTSKLQRQVQQQ